MKMWKKTMIGTLALSLMIGGATSAFAAKPTWAGQASWNASADFAGRSSIGFDAKGKVKVNMKFRDVEQEAAWALKYVAELAAQGVFKGYEDGSFRPNRQVTRIEAITAAVRQMGLQEEAESDEAMDTDLNFRDAEKIEKKYPWAVGYVALAVENDLFMETDAEVQPEKPADRLWATILLVKALGLEAEAKAAMNTELEFKDSREIPAGAVGYVAVALEEGLVTGYENNTFRPNKPISRAELAALLDRTGDQMDDVQTGKIEGIVTAKSGSKVTITDDGTSVQYEVSGDLYVIRNDKAAELDDILIGDEVTVVVADGEIILMSVTKAVTDDDEDSEEVEGTITAVSKSKISVTNDGKTEEYEVENDAVIVRNDAVVDFDILAVGDEISAVLTDDELVLITVTDAVSDNDEQVYTVEGKYESHRTEEGDLVQISITATQSGGPVTRIYNVSGDVEMKGGSAFSLVKGETELELTIENQEVTMISIK